MRWTRRTALFAALALLATTMATGTASAQQSEPDGLTFFPAEPVIDYAPGVDPSDPEVAAAAEALLAASAEQGRTPSAQAGDPLQVGGVVVTYNPTFPTPTAVRTIVDQAVFDWATTLDVGTAPLEINVSWRDLGSTGILGSAGPNGFFQFVGEDFLVPAPLTNVRINGDAQPGIPEIVVNLNSTFPAWYVGFGPVTGNRIDLYSVMLHELGHGFGFTGSAFGTPPELFDPPFGYDTHVYHGNNPLLNEPNPNALLTSDNLFFDLPVGPRHKLYAPGIWQQGSSYSHFDEDTYMGSDPGTLMTPSIMRDEAQRHLDAPVLGVMQQIGWDLKDPEALTVLPAPCPVHDSTSGTGPFAGPVAANTTRTVQVTGPLPAAQGVGTGVCVPTDATAVVVTLSAINPGGAGNFRLTPSGFPASGGVVNYTSNGLNNANTVTVPLPARGDLDIFANAAASGVRLTVLGFYSDNGTLAYNPLTPCTVADSRSTQGATGSFVGPFAAGAAYPDIDVVGTFPAGQGGGNTNCGVPAGADAIVVNLIAVNGSGGTGYLSAGPGGSNPSEPMTPFTDIGLNNAAAVLIPLSGETLAVDVESVAGSPTANIRVVVLGYLDTVGNDYFPLVPCTAFDSRPGQGASGGFLGQRVAGSATTYQLTGSIPSNQGGGGGNCGVPSGASAVLINLVGIQPNTVGNFRAYATGSSPTGGVLNFAPLAPAMNNSNAVVVPLSGGGQIDLFTNAPLNNGNPTINARGVILGYYD